MRDWTGFCFEYRGYQCRVKELMIPWASGHWWRIIADGIQQAKPLSSDELAAIELQQTVDPVSGYLCAEYANGLEE